MDELEKFQKKADNIFKPLEKYLIKEFNCFDILRISEMEIRHSNVLAFLLDTTGNHNLKNAFIESFFQLFKLKNGVKVDNFNNFKVIREYPTDKNRYIDIVLKNDNEKIVIAIENKINSDESEQQLLDYRTFIEREFKDYSQSFLYLTLHGMPPEDDEEKKYWTTIEHGSILEILENIISRDLNNHKVKYFLEDYIEVIRRLTMKDQELIDLCNKIYAENKFVLDLIYNNKDNSYIRNIIENYMELRTRNSNGKLEYPLKNKYEVSKKVNKNIILFRTLGLKRYISGMKKIVDDYYFSIEFDNKTIDVFLNFIPIDKKYDFSKNIFVEYLKSIGFNRPKKEKPYNNRKIYFCSFGGSFNIDKLDFVNVEQDQKIIYEFLNEIFDKLMDK